MTEAEEGTVESPTVDLYLERSQALGQTITVLVLENYLSKRYLDKRVEDLNKMKFQQKGRSQSHIRIYHKEEDQGEEAKGILFGRTDQTRILHLATTDGSPLENDYIAMSNQIFKWEDEAYKEVASKLYAEHDRRMQNSPMHCGTHSKTTPRSCSASVGTSNERCHESIDRRMGRASRYAPEDGYQCVDTCVLQAGFSPYEHHADNGDDICDNDDFCSSQKAMHVMTHCTVFRRENSKKKKKSVRGLENVDVTIRHGVPDENQGGANHKFCQIIGRFRGGTNACWKDWDGKLKGIPMGGQTHAHMQGRGSQFHHHHWIDPVSGEFRIVGSCRATARFQDTPDKRDLLRKKANKITSPEDHDTDHVLAIHTGKRRFIDTVPSALISEKDEIRPSTKRKIMRKADAGTSQDAKNKPRKLNKKEFMPSTHNNSTALPCETFNRNTVIGMNNFITNEALFRCNKSVEQLIAQQLTVRLQREDTNDNIIVGHYVVELLDKNDNLLTGDEGNPLYRRLQLAERLPDKLLDACCGINNNSRNSDIVNEKKMDTINLKQLTKNTPSVGRNMLRIKEGSGELEPIIIRGQGGVFTNAGTNAPRTSANTTHREAPMHILPCGQDLNSTNAQAWNRCLNYKQVLNVFFRGYFLGLYYVSRIVLEEKTVDEVNDYVCQFNDVMKKLHKIDCESFPADKIETILTGKSNPHYEEVCGMLGINQYITLMPVEPNIEAGMKHRMWRLMDFCSSNIIKPTIQIKANSLHKETNYSTNSTSEPTLINWSSLVEPQKGCSGLHHLKEERGRNALA